MTLPLLDRPPDENRAADNALLPGALTGRQLAVFVTERSLAQPPRSVAVRANALRCLLR
jgi:hypothetical protein